MEKVLTVCLVIIFFCVVSLFCVKAFASENPTPTAVGDSYEYFYPSVTLEYYASSDRYVASVVAQGVPSIPELVVSEPYSGIGYSPYTDPTLGIVTRYTLSPPLGGLGSTTVTVSTPWYVVTNTDGSVGLPVSLTETSYEWTVQLFPAIGSGIVFDSFTGTPTAFYSYLQANHSGALILSYSANSSEQIELVVNAISSSAYAYNLRNGIDTNTYYASGYFDGYTEGFDLGDTHGYNRGFDEGYELGLIDGYEPAYIEGYEDGEEVGYTNGYSQAITDGATDNPFAWILNLLDAIFSFTIIPMGDKGITVGGILTIVLAIPLLRLVLDFFVGG